MIYFEDVYRLVKGKTLLPEERARFLFEFSLKVKDSGVDGDVAEVGVYLGGSAFLISEVFDGTGKVVYLFDTFEGIPFSNPKIDIHREGEFASSYDDVRSFLGGFSNVRIVKGIFPKSAGEDVLNRKFCFVHLDVDVYESARDSLAFFQSRMVNGGVMVVDDYGSPNCPGVTKAVDEFLTGKNNRLVKGPGRKSCAILF
ncbi:MAG: TylF/MycF/NovP-related O-methyltransferase [Candidatus Bathyarchaeia archaeon]